MGFVSGLFRRLHQFAFSWLLLGPILLLPMAAAQAEPPLIVAVVGPMSDQLTAFGQQFQTGATAAVAALNSQPLLGRPIKVEVYDDMCDPGVAIAIAHKLIRERPSLVLGHVCSDTTLSVETLYAEANILQITAASTTSTITERGIATVLRMVGRDDRQGAEAGDLIARRWPKARIALINDGRAYGQGLVEAVSDSLHRHGLAPLLRERITSGAVSYGAVVDRLKQAQIDLIYFGGYEGDGALLLRQAREAGISARFIGGDALMNSDFHSTAGPAAEGALFTFPPDPRQQPEAAAASQLIRATGFEPAGSTLLAYAAVQVWYEGVRRAGRDEGRTVAEAIRQHPVKTVLGLVRFDAKGDIATDRPDFVWYHWRAGAPVPLSAAEQ